VHPAVQIIVGQEAVGKRWVQVSPAALANDECRNLNDEGSGNPLTMVTDLDARRI
jgi:hypothetical protein